MSQSCPVPMRILLLGILLTNSKVTVCDGVYEIWQLECNGSRFSHPLSFYAFMIQKACHQVTRISIKLVTYLSRSYSTNLRRPLYTSCYKATSPIPDVQSANTFYTQGLLRKISQQQAYLKDSEMWRVFLCLFRACVALTYPGKWAPEGFVPTNNVDAPTKEEFVPKNAAGAALPTDTGIIDFDMNDRNVMIGDFVVDPGPGHPHDQVPVVKVGDLGVVTRLLPRHRDNFFVLVAGRVRGNMWYHFPEQFTETWKNMDGMESLAADEVAGKYGWTSNLWQVGRLMTIMVRMSLSLAGQHEVPVTNTIRKNKDNKTDPRRAPNLHPEPNHQAGRDHPDDLDVLGPPPRRTVRPLRPLTPLDRRLVHGAPPRGQARNPRARAPHHRRGRRRPLRGRGRGPCLHP